MKRALRRHLLAALTPETVNADYRQARAVINLTAPRPRRHWAPGPDAVELSTGRFWASPFPGGEVAVTAYSYSRTGKGAVHLSGLIDIETLLFDDVCAKPWRLRDLAKPGTFDCQDLAPDDPAVLQALEYESLRDEVTGQLLSQMPGEAVELHSISRHRAGFWQLFLTVACRQGPCFGADLEEAVKVITDLSRRLGPAARVRFRPLRQQDRENVPLSRAMGLPVAP